MSLTRRSLFKSLLFGLGIVFIALLVNIPSKTSAAGITGAYFAPEKNLLLIEGSSFGGAQGASAVSIGGTMLGAATSWSDTDIYFASPSKNSGDISVNVSGGSIYSATIERLSTYTSYPSDPDQLSSKLISYYPFDSNLKDTSGINDLQSQNLKLYGSGLFGGKYEAIQTFSDPTTDWTSGTGKSRSVVRVQDKLLVMFYDGVWKYSVSSDDGSTWSTPQVRPSLIYFGLPTPMENGQWLYMKDLGWPGATFTPCLATNVTIDNIFSPESITCQSPVNITPGASFQQWQYEYLGNGRIVWPMYRYWGPFGGVMIASDDYGQTWKTRLMSDSRVVSGLTLASPITAGDTQVTLTDASGLTDSGFIKFTNGGTNETVSYGYKVGNTLHNIRKGNSGQYLVGSELNAQSPGTTNSFIVAGTTVKQDVSTPGEPTIIADPSNPDHLIMLQRHEGGGGSYVFRSESNDFGDTWSTFKIIYLDSYETGAPVRANNFFAYWTGNAGGSQGRIYLFARHWSGTRYFYSDDQGETWHGNNTQCSTKTENNYTMRMGDTWMLANDMDNIVEASDKSGLWLYWGTAIDDAANPPGTGTSRGALGKIFLSYDDSGSGKNLGYAFGDYNSSINLSNYSIDFWANIRQTHREINGTLISRMSSDGTKANYDIKIIGTGANKNKIQFRQYNDLTSSWNTIVSSTAFTNDSWNHVTATYDGSKMKLYINGKLESSLDSTSTHSGNEKLQIGYDASQNQLLYRGQMDNLKIYNSALSSKEVLERYNWAQPAISSLSASAAQAGADAKIYGTGFGANQGQNRVLVNGQSASIISWSDTEISFSVPNLSVGNYDLLVEVSGYDSNTTNLSIISESSSATSTPTTSVVAGLTVLPKTGTSHK